MARGPSVDLDGASLDPVQALGVGDQVLSFNKDLAVRADGDGAGAALESERLGCLNNQLLLPTGIYLRLDGNPQTAQHDSALGWVMRNADEHEVALGETTI